MAASMLAVAPVFAIYVIAQRYLLEGLASGIGK
jgi:ABC-type glycerol-3-phosphate transport system permease component